MGDNWNRREMVGKNIIGREMIGKAGDWKEDD